ncbi:MAG: beta-propeller domain-containing protein [Clostridia bacterium]|nr:beta-propeller domain-containing protein [Clostridia bacterium]
MKNVDKLARALDLVDDDLIERAAPGAYRKKENKIPWYKGSWGRWAVAACLALCLLTGVLGVMLGKTADPTAPTAPGLIGNGGEYGEIADKLQLVKGDDINEFNRLFPSDSPSQPDSPSEGGSEGGATDGDNGDHMFATGSDSTVVTVLNGARQDVAGGWSDGAIEPDTVGRTDTHLFFLTGGSLLVYTVNGEQSEPVGEYSRSFGAEAFFLSADGSRLTLISTGPSQVNVCVLNVADPANMTVISSFSAVGRYYAARLVNGKLLLLMGNSVIGEPDYTDESTFVPQYDAGNGLQPLPAANIHYPEKLTSTNYTVVYQLNEQTLTPEDSVGLLSYSGDIYVAGNEIFVTRPYVDRSETAARAMLEIARVSYADGALRYAGAASVEGVLKDRACIDAHNGTLRIVTNTRELVSEQPMTYRIKAALFCVDIAGMQVVSRLTDFAPEGKAVQAIRFDQSKVYVSVNETVSATEPAYCFDLAALSEIVRSEVSAMPTDVSGLIALRDGYLLGIGTGADGMLKVAVYRQNEGELTEVCSYTRTARPSGVPSSYLVDPETGLIGLAVGNLNESIGTEYILLQFNGEDLELLLCRSFNGFYKEARSFIADGYVYVISRSLTVLALEQA